jgi:nitrogen-specific signal transduction histidine kinase
LNFHRLVRLSPTILIVSFLFLFLLYIYYTQSIVSSLKEDEVILTRSYGKFWATALSEGGELEIIQEIFRNIDFPVLVIDKAGKVIHWENIELATDESGAPLVEDVKEAAAKLDRVNEPFSMVGPAGEMDFATIHYGESVVVTRLKYIPYLQAAVMIVFGLLAVLVIRYNLKSEKSLIWVGMARESAHQLGTPLSSLQGWLEILRERSREGKEISGDVLDSIQEDLTRLTKVANRFESVGRETVLSEERLEEILEELEAYFQKRLPAGKKKVKLSLECGSLSPVYGNRELLEWAFENMIKNSIDALEGKSGEISIKAVEKNGRIMVDLKDTGAGVPRDIRRQIFKTGITTKPRGWGVGLALAWRIISDYHGGLITLVSTGRGGTHFRVTLPLKGGRV